MRRIDLLIQEARNETDNVTFSDDTGIQDNQFLRWANSAQTRILSLVQQTHPDLFLAVTEIDVVTNQRDYDLPANTFLGTRIVFVEFSDTGQDVDFYQLKKGMLNEFRSGISALPSYYIRRDKTLILQPKPDRNGKLRITTQKILPRLDIRRAIVSSSVLDTSNNTITSLILDATQDIDSTQILNEGYMCVVDKDGNSLMNAIPVSAINTSTGVVTVDSSFVFEDGETIPANSFIVSGSFSSTNSLLDNVAERYLTEFMIWKCAKRDSNQDSQEQNQELMMLEQEIVASYAEPDDDVTYVPIIDTQFLDVDTRRVW